MIITTKNLTGPDIEIFKSDSSKFEIGGKDTKAAINMNTAEKYSRPVTIPNAITIKYSPNIQRSIPLNVIFNGFF
jgi:predicted transcriptional regulator